MKRIIFSLLIVLFGLSLSASGPKIAIDHTTHDFGNIKEDGGIVAHDFKITNTGDSPLIVISAKAACGCTVPKIPKEPIKPGESAVLKVSYDPKGRPGEFEKGIRVKTNVKGQRTTVKIKGVVVPSAR